MSEDLPLDDLLIPFQFNLPLQKSLRPERRHGAELWTIEGVGATEDKDQEEERVLHKGMDFRPYLETGAINWNHMEGPEFILGEPIEGRIIERSGKPSMFYTKGVLYDHQEKSQAVWRHINALEKAKAEGKPYKRKVGWSVQGGVVERSGKDIVKSVVRHMALTHEPVNPYTWAACAKSLAKSLQATQARQDDPITRLLFAPCERGCMEETGYFAKGFHGMLDHLALCHGVPVPQAATFVKALVHGGTAS